MKLHDVKCESAPRHRERDQMKILKIAGKNIPVRKESMEDKRGTGYGEYLWILSLSLVCCIVIKLSPGVITQTTVTVRPVMGTVTESKAQTDPMEQLRVEFECVSVSPGLKEMSIHKTTTLTDTLGTIIGSCIGKEDVKSEGPKMRKTKKAGEEKEDQGDRGHGRRGTGRGLDQNHPTDRETGGRGHGQSTYRVHFGPGRGNEEAQAERRNHEEQAKAGNNAGARAGHDAPLAPNRMTKEDLELELAAAQNKPRSQRYRHMDHEARLRATPDELQRYERALEHGDSTIGLYPCGDDIDRQNAIDELEKEKVKIDDEAIELRCIKHFLCDDMGMTELVFEDLDEQLIDWKFEGSTAFLRFDSRRGVIQVWSFASLMNRMANRRRVSRKLHLWVPSQLETRFFQLKDLEWQYRRMKKNRKEPCQTRLAYSNGTIMAQWRSSPDMLYVNIKEPESQHIAGVEYWRTTAVPRLNRRQAGPPIHKPDLRSAATPKGRDRKDQEKPKEKIITIKAKVDVRRQLKFKNPKDKNPKAGGSGTGANAEPLGGDTEDEDLALASERKAPAKIDADAIPMKNPKSKGKGKGKGKGSKEKKTPIKEDEPAESVKDKPNREDEGKMETDSWTDENGQLRVETPPTKSAEKPKKQGNSNAMSEAAEQHSKTPSGRRGPGRPRKVSVTVQNTPRNQRTMNDFITSQSKKKSVKRTRSARRDEDRSDSDMDSNVENKAAKIEDVYQDLVGALKDSGALSAKKAAVYTKALMHAKQEEKFFTSTANKIKKGEEPSFAILAVKNQLMAKVGKKINRRLTKLDTEAKAITYESSSSSSSASSSSSSSAPSSDNSVDTSVEVEYECQRIVEISSDKE